MIDAHIQDPDVLGAQTPSALATYLRASGWTLVRRTETAAYWTLPTADGDEFEVQQPLEQELRDYALRVGDAFVVLAKAEQTSELEVLRRITWATWDVHTVKLSPADEPPGMLPIEDGVSAYESLRSLVVASAYPIFTNQHRAVQPARKPQGLVDFVRAVRIGPGGEGSYTLTAHTPVPPLLSGQPSLFNDLVDGFVGAADDTPVGRKVSLRMHRAVHAAQAAADAALLSSDGLEPFTGAVAHGVSANLCEALVGLGGGVGHPFQVSVSLAAVRRHPATLAPVRFRRHHLPVLREAADELRARTPEEDVSVTGEVVRLHRESRTAGEITLVGRVDEQEPLRRIWLGLPSGEYEQAMRAHQEMREVTVRGNLVRRGTRFYLVSPTGFRLLGAAAPG